jgi:hypothetical protein
MLQRLSVNFRLFLDFTQKINLSESTFANKIFSAAMDSFIFSQASKLESNFVSGSGPE